MAWMGMSKDVENALRTVGADTDENGKFLIAGSPPISFLGLGDEMVIKDEVMFMKGGQPCSLTHLMNGTSCGLRNITVF